MIISKILRDSGRYDDIIKILEKISMNNNYDFPVNAYVDNDNKTKWRVPGDDVRKGAVTLLSIIKNNEVITEASDQYECLRHVVETSADIMLHNYANFLSHRIKPIDDMENIRAYQILSHLLFYIGNEEIMSWGDFTVPVGWKKQ